ncbi:MAG: BspA family leucine-rich repeat surface protein [Micrococcales bacterium]
MTARHRRAPNRLAVFLSAFAVFITTSGLAAALILFPVQSATAATNFSLMAGWDPPAGTTSASAAGLELGTRITTAVSGAVTQVRFYKFSDDTSPEHTAQVWDSSGNLLATKAFVAETAAGWQTVTFDSPISIGAGSQFTVSVYGSNYSFQNVTWGTVPKISGPLTVDSGYYNYGSVSAFPGNTFNDSNYMVDLTFSTNLALQPGALTLTLQTTNANTDMTFGIGTQGGAVTDISVDWGDFSTPSGPFNGAVSASHTYARPGTYTVQIYGTKLESFGQYSYANQYITAIDSWGAVGLTNLQDACIFCFNLESVPSTLPAGTTSLFRALAFTRTFNQDLTAWDTSSVTDFSELFAHALAFNNGEIGNNGLHPLTWDTSKATSFANMFTDARAFNQNIGTWDTRNVTDLNGMFYQSPLFNWDLSAWDTSKVTNMAYVFCATGEFNQPLKTWDVSAVTNFTGMFAEAAKFDQDIGSWNPTSATSVIIMFRGGVFDNAGQSMARTATTWNFPNLRDTHQMFQNSQKFNRDIGSWDVSAITDTSSMFESAAVFNRSLSSWNVSKVTNMSAMFANAPKFDQNLANWDMSNVTDANYFLAGAKLSSANYGALLTSLASQPLKSNVLFHGGSSEYPASAAAARTKLVDPTGSGGFGWSITDGGQVKPAPSITSWPTASPINLGDALGSSVLSGGDSGSVPGVFSFETPTDTPAVGQNLVNVVFTPSDLSAYSPVTTQITVTVLKLVPTATFPSTSIAYSQSLLTATLSGATSSVPGTFSFVDSSALLEIGTNLVDALFTPSDSASYQSLAGKISVTVEKATPRVTTTPAASSIAAGQTLAQSTLSGGVASVSGTFAFTFPTETPSLGSQTVNVTFTPADTTHFNTVSFNVVVDVMAAPPTKTTPTVTFPSAVISYGQSLLTAMLNGASASVAGVFSFADSLLEIGSHLVAAVFTPNDTASYNTVSGQINFTVTKATPQILTTPIASSITTQQTLAASTLSGGSASVPGIFSYQSPGSRLMAGAQEVSVTFTPNDTVHYNSVSLSVVVTVTTVAPPTEEPTPTPTPTATPEPSASATPSQSPTPSPTTTPNSTPQPTPNATPTPSPRPSMSPSPSATPTPAPTAQATAQASPAPTSTPGAASGSNPGRPTPVPSKSSSAAGSEPVTEAVSMLVTATLETLSSAVGVNLPELQPGQPIANPAIGATGDDNAPPQTFSALGSPESIAAATKTVAAAVSIAVAAAGAAGAAASVAGSAAGSAGSGANSGSGSARSENSGSDSSHGKQGPDGGSIGGQSEDEWTPKTYAKKLFAEAGLSPGWGDQLPIFATTAMTIVDSASLRIANLLARKAPLIGKGIQNSAYLRGMLGSFAWLLPVVNVCLAIVALAQNHQQNPGIPMSPPWFLFLLMSVFAVFDAFAGMLAAAVFIGGSVLVLASESGLATFGSWVVFVGVALALFGPSFLLTGFRKLNRQPDRTISYWWERATDFLVCAFLSGWLLSSIVSSMPALAGHTLPVANHLQDFALAGALAGAGRVVLEEIAGRAFPVRTNWQSHVQFSKPTSLTEVHSLAFKALLWGSIASAMFGFSWQIVVGTLLFLIPNVFALFAERLPNSPWLWKVIPTGLPGLMLNLGLGLTATFGLAVLGGLTPEIAKYSFIVMPIPLLALGILKEFGRSGGPDGRRFIQPNALSYRLGGILVYLLTLKLAGVF